MSGELAADGLGPAEVEVEVVLVRKKEKKHQKVGCLPQRLEEHSVDVVVDFLEWCHCCLCGLLVGLLEQWKEVDDIHISRLALPSDELQNQKKTTIK